MKPANSTTAIVCNWATPSFDCQIGISDETTAMHSQVQPLTESRVEPMAAAHSSAPVSDEPEKQESSYFETGDGIPRKIITRKNLRIVGVTALLLLIALYFVEKIPSENSSGALNKEITQYGF